jgi:hypothetical protein
MEKTFIEKEFLSKTVFVDGDSATGLADPPSVMRANPQRKSQLMRRQARLPRTAGPLLPSRAQRGRVGFQCVDRLLRFPGVTRLIPGT